MPGPAPISEPGKCPRCGQERLVYLNFTGPRMCLRCVAETKGA